MSYLPDGFAPDACSGSQWDVAVVDNTQSSGVYVMQETATHAAAAVGLSLRAALTHGGAAYTSRVAAPYALLDTSVAEIEKVCDAEPAVELPPLLINGALRTGRSAAASRRARLGLLTTAATRAAIRSCTSWARRTSTPTSTTTTWWPTSSATFSRTASTAPIRWAGPHGLGDVLDPTVAFGEGFGNALSAIVFNDPIYVDTVGSGQVGGLQVRMDVPPSGDDRSVFSENSVQHLLWRLYDARDGTPRSGNYDRIHAVLKQHRTLAAVSTLHAFAAGYNAAYGGAAEGLQTLFSAGGTLESPYAALCQGRLHRQRGYRRLLRRRQRPRRSLREPPPLPRWLRDRPLRRVLAALPPARGRGSEPHRPRPDPHRRLLRATEQVGLHPLLPLPSQHCRLRHHRPLRPHRRRHVHPGCARPVRLATGRRRRLR